jgi:hypothetical protein
MRKATLSKINRETLIWVTREGSGLPSLLTCITLADLLMPCKANSLLRTARNMYAHTLCGQTPSSLNGKPGCVYSSRRVAAWASDIDAWTLFQCCKGKCHFSSHSRAVTLRVLQSKVPGWTTIHSSSLWTFSSFHQLSKYFQAMFCNIYLSWKNCTCFFK